MRKGGGKAKGSAFEREICKALSLWVTGGKHEDVFWRSAMSGGRSTVAHAKGKRLAAQAGDISCIHPAGEVFASRFMCECKAYADLNYAGLLSGKGHLAEFWEVAKIEAERYNKLPFLIAKQNRQPTTICLSLLGVMVLNTDLHIKAVLTVPPLDMFIFNADRFLENVVPFDRRSPPD